MTGCCPETSLYCMSSNSRCRANFRPRAYPRCRCESEARRPHGKRGRGRWRPADSTDHNASSATNAPPQVFDAWQGTESEPASMPSGGSMDKHGNRRQYHQPCRYYPPFWHNCARQLKFTVSGWMAGSIPDPEKPKTGTQKSPLFPWTLFTRPPPKPRLGIFPLSRRGWRRNMPRSHYCEVLATGSPAQTAAHRPARQPDCWASGAGYYRSLTTNSPHNTRIIMIFPIFDGWLDGRCNIFTVRAEQRRSLRAQDRLCPSPQRTTASMQLCGNNRNFQSTDGGMDRNLAVWNHTVYTARHPRDLFRAAIRKRGAEKCEKRTSCSHLRIYFMRGGGGQSYLGTYL